MNKGNDSSNLSNKEHTRTTLVPNENLNGVLLHKRYKETIVDKIVEIVAKDLVGSFRESHFINCEIKIRCSGRHTQVMTDECTFENCLIRMHTKQIIADWNAKFINCSFKGRLEGRFKNKLINCDFSECNLSIVGLLANNSFEELKGIHYPTIAILDAKENFKQWAEIEKPKDFKDLIRATAITPHAMVIMTLNEFTKEPDRLWNSIKHLDFIKTVGKE